MRVTTGRTTLLGWLTLTALAALALVATTSACRSDAGYNEAGLVLATTTSLNDSGLLDELVPLFEAEEELNVKIISVGTGAALRMGTEGNADVLLTHAPIAEQELVEAGDVINRTLVAYNDFVIVGPRDDPAGVAGTSDVAAALAQIADAGAIFASRGDDSGTHKKEIALWRDADRVPSVDSDEWYLEVGQGMSATLIVANQRGAYSLTDRGTFLSLSDHMDQLTPLVSGDVRLLNFYSVMEVNGAKGRINTAAAKAFRQFLLRDDIQALIGEYLREEYGQPLCIPAAGETEATVSVRAGAAPN